MTPKLTPLMLDAETKRKHIREKVLEGLKESFPIQSRSKTLEVEDLRIDEKEYSSSEQKRAILRGDTLSERVRGTLRMRDKDGKVIDEVKNFTVAQVPWFTPRHTLVVGGNEYTVANQVRPKPGVYARKRANGVLEANFNTKGGSNFNVTLDPEKGEPQLEYKSSKIPLYPVLREAGISHDQIAKRWGSKVADRNAKNLMRRKEKVIDKLYTKVVPSYQREAGADTQKKVKEVFNRYTRAEMDPEVNRRTLGKPYSNVTPDALLAASDKVLRIYKNPGEIDDRDNLDFKALHSVDDAFKEIITYNARNIAKKAAIKMEAAPNLRKAIPAGPFTSSFIRHINTSQRVTVPTQTNPMELIDSAMRVTAMGEGGISSDRAIPMDARQVHATQMGALDPFRTPESFRAGVDVRAAMEVRKDDQGNIYVPLRDAKTGKNVHVRAGELQDQIVAFPGEKLTGMVDALQNGQIRRVPASRVKYQSPHPSLMYSPTTNLVPFLESLQGNRAVMGSKMQTQALSLVEREAPLVQVQSPTGESFERHMASLINPTAPVSGTVAKVDDDYIYLRPDNEKTAAPNNYVKIPYEKNFPLAAKTYLHHDLNVKKGDRVTKGQQVGESNFSRDNTLALGKNMSVAYMPYRGANSNDAIVISSSAAKKLTSERMYTVVVPRDNDMAVSKEKHRVYYGQGYTKDQYDKLDKDGVIKPGAKIKPGDPTFLGLRKSTMSADDLLLGRLHKSLARPYREQAQSWDHDHEGEVVDVVKTPKRIAYTIKTKEPMQIGDKLCYTEDTEVLTATGWVPVSEVTYRTACYTLNSAGIIELHTPTALHYYDEADELYELESQQVNLRVTPNHHLYVKSRGAKLFKLQTAAEVIGKRVKHKKDGKWKGVTPKYVSLAQVAEKKSGRKPKPLAPIPTLPWCRFLGAYLANGSYTMHSRKDRGNTTEYRVQVHTAEGQTHSVSGDQHTWIQKLIEDCGFKGQLRKDRHIISSRQLTEYLSRFGHASDKHIPAEVFSWGVDAAEAVLTGLLGCDGNLSNSGSLSYCTTSQQLANDVQRLALHAGWAANIKRTVPDNPNWNIRYDVRIIRKKLHPEVNHGHVKAQEGQCERIVKSKDPVWGITVPNHTLYVRVKGTPVWSGNSGRYGNKGVVSQIIEDDKMIQDESGKPIDVIMTSAGVVSRTNPSQIIETAVGKVAEKTGKPIVVENLSGRDNVKWAKDLLKKHKIKDKETVFDPVTGKKIPKVFVGRQYLLKLMKSTDTNYRARGLGSYDVNQQPTKGGVSSAQALGKMEFEAFVAHNARNVLRETSTLKSQKNDEYWKAVQLGYPTPPPKSSFAYDKFLGMLNGAGVKVNRDSTRLSLGPMTDAEVTMMSSGAIKEPKLIKAKGLTPEKGGLFDPAITGGLTGSKWAHIDLAEPIVNPVFRDPARRLLGLTNPELDKVLAEKGGEYVKKQLAKIDPVAKEKEILKGMKRKSANNLDNDVKQVKFLRALQKQGLRPDEATIVSKVPVVPPVFRPILPGKNGQDVIYGDINPLYRDLLYANNQLKEVKKSQLIPGEEKRLRPTLNAAVGAVYGVNDPVTEKSKARKHKGFLTYISGVNSPKNGYFHSKLLRKTQDMAGRGTIVPDSTLGMNEVGLPEEMLWTMYDKFIVKGLVQNGYSALEANKMVKERAPAAKNILQREVKERPVILNRAPTLHRYSMIGAFPKMVPGKTIRVNPFVEAGSNADYDGDSTDSYLGLTINGHYVRLHISECPHIKESIVKKGNKEKYDVAGDVKVFGYSEEKQQVVLCDVTHFSIHHDLEMVNVRTKSGRTVKVSRDHSMFGLSPKTGKLERFRAEDGIGWGTPRPRKLFAPEQLQTLKLRNKELYPEIELTRDLGWFLGAWAGDGWVSHDKRTAETPLNIGLSKTDFGVQRKFAKIAEDLKPGVSVKRYGNHHEFHGTDCYSEKLHVNSRPLARLMDELTQECRGAENKKLPSFFVQAPREFLLGLMGGLIDSDGTVSIVKAKAKNKPQIMAHYTTRSEALADHVGVLATMLGIRSNVYSYFKKGEEDGTQYFQITFSTPDLAKIAKELPSVHTDKKRNLDILAKETFDPAAPENARWDMVPMPTEIATALRALNGNASKPIKNASPEVAAARKATANRYQKLTKAVKEGKISRVALQEIVQHLGEEAVRECSVGNWFELAMNPTILWDFIAEIEHIEGRHTAWDLTVPDGNTFMTANQLIVFDTMSVHVPVGNKAVEEAKQMTLSNVLYGDKSKNDLLVFPQHESVMGLAHASEVDDKNTPISFKTKGDAMKAYKDGKIGLGTRVKIGK